MAVTLRLARYGTNNRPFYRIVAADKDSPRDGRYLEIVGHYNPRTNPPTFDLKEDRVERWIKVGAQPTTVVANLINKKMNGLVKKRVEHKRSKIQAARKARKARAKGGKTAKAKKK